jgi:type IV pilus assembly protein PilA
MSIRRNKGFTLIELMIVVAIIGILAAIAIPNFIRFQARSKQGEAKTNLKSLFTAQRSFFQEKDRYSTLIHEIGFSPERGNRYAYHNGATNQFENRTTVAVTTTTTDTAITVDTFKYTGAATDPTAGTGTATWSSVGGANPSYPAGIGSGTCPDCNFAGYAAGNVDNESSTFDTWVIASKDATIAAACGNSDTAAPAGNPFNTNNDVTCGN